MFICKTIWHIFNMVNDVNDPDHNSSCGTERICKIPFISFMPKRDSLGFLPGCNISNFCEGESSEKETSNDRECCLPYLKAGELCPYVRFPSWALTV